MKNNFQNTLPLEAGRVSPKASKAAAKSGNPVGDIVTPNQNPFVHHLFSTPIWHNKCIDNFGQVQDELDEVIPQIDFKMIPSWGSTHYLSTQNFRDDLFEKYKLDALLKEIQRNVIAYCKELRFETRPFQLTSWLSKFGQGCYGHIHNHGTSDISGVYYYSTNGEDGNIFFQTPAPGHEMSRCFSQYCGGARHYIPREGVLLLFPGFLDHGINTNTTDNVRISLSFNINFKQ